MVSYSRGCALNHKVAISVIYESELTILDLLLVAVVRSLFGPSSRCRASTSTCRMDATRCVPPSDLAHVLFATKTRRLWGCLWEQTRHSAHPCGHHTIAVYGCLEVLSADMMCDCHLQTRVLPLITSFAQEILPSDVYKRQLPGQIPQIIAAS